MDSFLKVFDSKLHINEYEEKCRKLLDQMEADSDVNNFHGEILPLYILGKKLNAKIITWVGLHNEKNGADGIIETDRQQINIQCVRVFSGHKGKEDQKIVENKIQNGQFIIEDHEKLTKQQIDAIKKCINEIQKKCAKDYQDMDLLVVLNIHDIRPSIRRDEEQFGVMISEISNNIVNDTFDKIWLLFSTFDLNVEKNILKKI